MGYIETMETEDWESWARAYPVREITCAMLDVLTKAGHSDQGPFDLRSEADGRKDWLEMTYECGGYEVVRCINQFWIIR